MAGRPTIEGRPSPTPNPQMVEIHKKRLQDTNLTIRQRATALGVLRTQHANKADDIVDLGLGLLGQAQEPGVRALILRNLQGAENPRVLPTVLGLLKLDADEDVRDEAARLVGEYVSRPEAKAALEAAVAGDVSDKVKRRAQTALNTQQK
jgi:HEAT repeat protein